MNILEKIVGVIVRPLATFKGLCEEHERGERGFVRDAILVVIAHAILTSAGAYMALNKVEVVMPEEPVFRVVMAAIRVGTLFTSVVVVVAWLVLSLVVYALARLLGGGAGFVRTAILLAYAYIPALLLGIVSLALLIATPPVRIEVTSLQELGAKMGQISRMARHLSWISLDVISWISMAWSTALYVLAVRSAHGLSWPRSVVAGGLPGLAMMVLATLQYVLTPL